MQLLKTFGCCKPTISKLQMTAFKFCKILTRGDKSWSDPTAEIVCAVGNALQQGHTRNLGDVWTRVTSNDRGEVGAGYKWATGWVWEITGWSSRLEGNDPSFCRSQWNIPQIIDEKRNDVNMQAVALGNTRMLTDNAQQSPRPPVTRIWRDIQNPK